MTVFSFSPLFCSSSWLNSTQPISSTTLMFPICFLLSFRFHSIFFYTFHIYRKESTHKIVQTRQRKREKKTNINEITFCTARYVMKCLRINYENFNRNIKWNLRYKLLFRIIFLFFFALYFQLSYPTTIINSACMHNHTYSVTFWIHKKLTCLPPPRFPFQVLTAYFKHGNPCVLSLDKFVCCEGSTW